MKLYLTILLALSFSVNAQINQPTIIEHTFISEAFDTERKISIALPTGYSESDSTTKYIVAYLFDGQFNPYFSMVHSVVDYYSQISEGVPMIVVSIHTTNRSLEFTPKWNHEGTVRGWRGNCGNAEVLTTSLRDEIIPYIEDKYHTKKYRLGIGHSLGGTYVMQEIFNDESIFDGVIAVSPNLRYDSEQIVDQGRVFFSKTPSADPFIYASAGDQGEMEYSFRVSLQKLDSIHSSDVSTSSNWECQWLDGDGHMSAFLPTFNYAYLSFSKNWQLTDDQLDEFARDPETFFKNVDKLFASMTSFAGEKVEPSVDDYNNFGYALAYNEKYDEALEAFNKGIQSFPKDLNIHDSKGEILQEIGKYEEARESYQNGLALLKNNPSYYSEDDLEFYTEMLTTGVDQLSDDFINYKKLIVEAKASFAEKKYSSAAKSFSKAFNLNIIQATHIDRKIGVAAFAQAKKYDAAFEQLELLANKFEWEGREIFVEDELMNPLHSDKRWEEIMKVMDQNKLKED